MFCQQLRSRLTQMFLTISHISTTYLLLLIKAIAQGPLLLTSINFNPSMDK